MISESHSHFHIETVHILLGINFFLRHLNTSRPTVFYFSGITVWVHFFWLIWGWYSSVRGLPVSAQLLGGGFSSPQREMASSDSDMHSSKMLNWTFQQVQQSSRITTEKQVVVGVKEVLIIDYIDFKRNSCKSFDDWVTTGPLVNHFESHRIHRLTGRNGGPRQLDMFSRSITQTRGKGRDASVGAEPRCLHEPDQGAELLELGVALAAVKLWELSWVGPNLLGGCSNL